MKLNRRFRRSWLRVVTLVVAPIAAMTAIAAPAFAYSNGMFQSLYNKGYCLDSNYNGQVYMNPCGSSNNYQHWVMTMTGTKAYDGSTQIRLKNSQTGLYLQMWRPNGAVIDTTPDGADPTTVLDGVGPGWYAVMLRGSSPEAMGWQNSPLCVDAYFGNVVANSCTNTADEYWEWVA